jgi:5-(carboxyamino)imidazole ribonucleotide synthase
MISSNIDPNNSLTLGILGGGQLAKMIANEAYRLGIKIAIIENGTNTPAGDMTKFDFTFGWENKEELDKFLEVSDIITLENEFINPSILDYVATKRKIFPSPNTMRLVQDKLTQKLTFKNNGLNSASFAELTSIEDAESFGGKFGFPFLIKTRRNGYDGYGNATIKTKKDISIAWNKFKENDINRELMAESYVNFTKELAVMVARNENGESVIYPCVETIQENHICHKVIAPAEVESNIQILAQEIAKKVVESINGVGIFGVEMFLTSENDILVNEIAPRPHNSGHYTIEACYTSQFENCIRAVLNLPLGNPELILPNAVMINLLGSRDGSGVPKDTKEVHKTKAFLHLYNKKSSRKGRKMGHITAIANSATEANNIAETAYKALTW